MKIKEFAFVGYPVTNLPEAFDFYERVLGLKRASSWGNEEKGWFEYEIGPHTLAITNMTLEWKPSGNGPAVALEVDDFDATIEHLRSKLVRFESEPFSTPVCRMAIIRDPDGNNIAIHQRHKHKEKSADASGDNTSWMMDDT